MHMYTGCLITHKQAMIKRNDKQKQFGSSPNQAQAAYCVYGGIKRLSQVFAFDATPRLANSSPKNTHNSLFLLFSYGFFILLSLILQKDAFIAPIHWCQWRSSCQLLSC
jgi:hypothetical protein